MKPAESARGPVNAPRLLPDPPDHIPAERPDDQDAFDEAMKVGYKGIRELLERRRKQR